MNIIPASITYTGATGKYDGVVSNPNYRAGRNAVAKQHEAVQNMKDELNKLCLKADDPTLSRQEKSAVWKKIAELNKSIKKADDFKMQYTVDFDEQTPLEDKKLSVTESAIAAAYEDLGNKTSVSVAEFDEKLKQTFGEGYTGAFLDVNKDGRIDVSEYGAAWAIMDEMSDDKVDGKISAEGMKTFVAEHLRKDSKTSIGTRINTFFKHLPFAQKMAEFTESLSKNDENGI